MARIRAVEIRNFRGIKGADLVSRTRHQLPDRPRRQWEVVNPRCGRLVASGRAGASNLRMPTSHLLDVETPLTIEVTLGELDDGLKNLDAYGMYLRGFDTETGTIEDEPENGCRNRADSEAHCRERFWSRSGHWCRHGPRQQGADAESELGRPCSSCPHPHRCLGGLPSGLAARLGAEPRVRGTPPDASAALAKAARDARAAFGDQAQVQLGETLGIVATTAKELGIPIGENIKAMLDAHSVSFSGGTISPAR